MSNLGVTIIMSVLFVVIIAIDIWLAADGRKGNTYSERLRAWGKIWPPFRLLIAFGFGLLASHWYWPPPC